MALRRCRDEHLGDVQILWRAAAAVSPPHVFADGGGFGEMARRANVVNPTYHPQVKPCHLQVSGIRRYVMVFAGLIFCKISGNFVPN